MSGVLTGVFWVAVATLVYVYGGFALLIALYGRVRRRHVIQRPITPTISMLVAAHNEEAHIAKKIANTLALDYPEQALELVIGSDGSDDQTEAIVSQCADPRVRLVALPRRGKIHVLNDCVPLTTGEILVFSDANTHLDPAALKNLARNFADPSVGGVCGNQFYSRTRDAESSGAGERLYWSYDKWLKKQQNRCGSIVAADGALYAIRRELYAPPATAAVTDDFAISTAVVERGMRLVYEDEALAYEPETRKATAEFRRKVRIVVRGLRGVILRRRLLNPFRHGFYSVVLFSHKVLRRLAPVFLVAALVSSIALAGSSSFFRMAAALQLAFYALAAMGCLMRGRRAGRSRLFYTPFHYCLVNLAALVGVTQVLRGVRIESWQPDRHRAATG